MTCPSPSPQEGTRAEHAAPGCTRSVLTHTPRPGAPSSERLVPGKSQLEGICRAHPEGCQAGQPRGSREPSHVLRPSFREPPGHPGGPAQASPPDSNTSWSGACGSGGAREDPTPTGRQGRRCQLPLQSSREALVACTHLFSRVCMHSFTRVCVHSFIRACIPKTHTSTMPH